MGIEGRITDRQVRDRFSLSGLGRSAPGDLPPKRILAEIDCRECPEVFSGSGAWGRYAKHLKVAHRAVGSRA